jgi:hypothetical protein
MGIVDVIRFLNFPILKFVSRKITWLTKVTEVSRAERIGETQNIEDTVVIGTG